MNYFPGEKEQGWTAFEEVLLVGSVYSYLYTNPTLTRSGWAKIRKHFKKDCELFQGILSHQRSSVELRIWFEKLTEVNECTNGAMFMSMFETWKQWKRVGTSTSRQEGDENL
eukprot:snap_masked-scaffold_6-processed-gene-1.20-mRNA-1 protein AED:1.00 eAED:1.00 QI:0/-1/0/0/-1/1/1/0/111